MLDDFQWKFWKNCTERSTKKAATFEGEQSEGYEDSENAFEDIKVKNFYCINQIILSSLINHPRKLLRQAAESIYFRFRYSSRRSRRRCRPSRHRASSGSLRDHPRLQPHVLRSRPRKSDSSNRASAETSSSTESSCRGMLLLEICLVEIQLIHYIRGGVIK